MLRSGHVGPLARPGPTWTFLRSGQGPTGPYGRDATANDVNLPVDNDENLQNLETKLLNQAFKDQIVSLALVMYKNLSISLGRQERLGREGSTLGRHGDAHVQDRGFLKIFLGDCPFQYTDTRKLKR